MLVLLMVFSCRLILRCRWLAFLLAGMFIRIMFGYNDLVCVSDFGQVVYVWQGVNLLDNIKHSALIFIPDFGNGACDNKATLKVGDRTLDIILH